MKTPRIYLYEVNYMRFAGVYMCTEGDSGLESSAYQTRETILSLKPWLDIQERSKDCQNWHVKPLDGRVRNDMNWK